MVADLDAQAARVNLQLGEIQRQYEAALSEHVLHRKPYPTLLRRRFQDVLIQSERERMEIMNRGAATARGEPDGGLARVPSGGTDARPPAPEEAIQGSPAVDLFFPNAKKDAPAPPKAVRAAPARPVQMKRPGRTARPTGP
jgi:hypothetical protein